jgi:hypothetical protein
VNVGWKRFRRRKVVLPKRLLLRGFQRFGRAGGVEGLPTCSGALGGAKVGLGGGLAVYGKALTLTTGFCPAGMILPTAAKWHGLRRH